MNLSSKGDLGASVELLRQAERTEDDRLVWTVWGHLWYHHPEHQHIAARRSLGRPLPPELGGDGEELGRIIHRRLELAQANARMKDLSGIDWNKELNRTSDIVHISPERAEARFAEAYGFRPRGASIRDLTFLSNPRMCQAWLVYGTSQVADDPYFGVHLLNTHGWEGWKDRLLPHWSNNGRGGGDDIEPVACAALVLFLEGSLQKEEWYEKAWELFQSMRFPELREYERNLHTNLGLSHPREGFEDILDQACWEGGGVFEQHPLLPEGWFQPVEGWFKLPSDFQAQAPKRSSSPTGRTSRGIPRPTDSRWTWNHRYAPARWSLSLLKNRDLDPNAVHDEIALNISSVDYASVEARILASTPGLAGGHPQPRSKTMNDSQT